MSAESGIGNPPARIVDNHEMSVDSTIRTCHVARDLFAKSNRPTFGCETATDGHTLRVAAIGSGNGYAG